MKLTITVNGTKAGELVYFFINIVLTKMDEALEEIENLKTIQDVLNGESKGLYTIDR